MDSHDVKLILLALAAIAALVLLVTRWKLNAFIALLLAALILGAGSGMALPDVLKHFQDGLGAAADRAP